MSLSKDDIKIIEGDILGYISAEVFEELDPALREEETELWGEILVLHDSIEDPKYFLLCIGVVMQKGIHSLEVYPWVIL